jgi:membrane-associated protein
MDHLPPFITYSLHVAAHFKYVLLFIGTIIEGPIIMIASGFLLHLGIFTFWPLFISLALGDLVGDILWYYIGYYYAERFIKRFGKFFGLTLENFEKVKSIFSRHHKKIMFFSKLTMGFGLAIYILMVAGATRVHMKTYLIINFIGELFFVLMLLVLGSSFGKIYNSINHGFKIGFIIIAGIVVVVFIYNMQKYLRQRALKS